MFVYSVLLSASLLAFAGAPSWVVPIGAAILLLENRDVDTARPRSSSSLEIKLARNITFVALSFALGLLAAWLFSEGGN